jgi:hypothetical protein
MANWKTDLAAFVEETTAFANSLRVEPPMPHTIIEPDPIPTVKWMDSEREEIRQRVAKFKAHQQRLIQDRKDYAASEWERALASGTVGKRATGAR